MTLRTEITTRQITQGSPTLLSLWSLLEFGEQILGTTTKWLPGREVANHKLLGHSKSPMRVWLQWEAYCGGEGALEGAERRKWHHETLQHHFWLKHRVPSYRLENFWTPGGGAWGRGI